MKKKTLRDLHGSSDPVLVRVDFNVPMRDGEVADHRRIRAALPTLTALIGAGHRVICVSHLGRPRGKPDAALSLRPVARVLSEQLGQDVSFVPASVGPQVAARVADLRPGGVLLLENLRFHPEEEANDPGFARLLAAPATAFVNDAFGTAHRAHASTEAVVKHLSPAVAGHLMEAELDALARLETEVEHPYLAVLGGAKISGKIELIENLLPRVDAVLVGGAMAYTLLRAAGVSTGGARVEEDRVETARELLRQARERGVPLLLPVDHRVAGSLDADQARVTEDETIPADLLACDIGPATVKLFTEKIAEAATVLWNGPMGVFENPVFAEGTRQVGEAIAVASAFTVVGGGDSAAAVSALGITPGFDHVSTGGGATLELLSGRVLPGLAALDDRP